MPLLNPIVVEIDETSAEWLEGIPPVFQKSNSTKFLKEVIVFVNKVMIVFMN